MELWRYTRDDRNAVLLIALLPFLVALPQLIGWLKADPLLYTGQMTVGFAEGVLRGVPYIDPNNGFGTQALGRRAALEWLQGNIPWWNYYTGVGLPLAAEYQPAAFFPLTLLMLIPQGLTLQQAILQVLCGWGTYALLRQLGLGRFAATAGGILYAFNGTLAWHSHAPATAMPFLPWMLLGIERAYACASLGKAGGWRLLACAMAMGLLCGFPETSFLSGLLALAWAVVRGLQCMSSRRRDYAIRILVGGLTGIAIAAPQVLAFFEFLPQANIGDHANFGSAIYHQAALVPSLLMPYAFGQIFYYAWGNVLFESIWGGIGGFVTGGVLVAAVYGFWTRRDPLAWLLVAWIALALGRSFGLEPMMTLVNLIPGVTYTAFPRYAPPSWEFAIILLAVRGLDQVVSNTPRARYAAVATTVAGVLAVVAAGAALFVLWPQIKPGGMRNAAWGSLAWLVLTLVITTAVFWWHTRAAARVLAGLLVVEAMLMTFIPTLSNPRGGAPDIPAIHFLRNNLGMARFFTLGPIQPNYGAYFGVASINHNYLPVSRRWVEWIQANLDRHVDPVVFNGNYPRTPGSATQTEELRRNLANYSWVGVKYVVAGPNDQPLAGSPGVRRVYADSILSIHELPDPSPYFESLNARCHVLATDRERVIADCAEPDTLVRRELFYPGWSAKAGERDLPIVEHRGLFQAVALPKGRTELRFAYKPPHMQWAWLAALLGLLVLALPTATRALRSARRSRLAT